MKRALRSKKLRGDRGVEFKQEIDRKLYLTPLPGERESPWKGSEKQHEKDNTQDKATQPSTSVNVNVNVSK